jgi:thymidylate kinase
VFALLGRRLTERYERTILYHDPPWDCQLGQFVQHAWKQWRGLDDEVFHLLFASASVKAQRDNLARASGSSNVVLVSDRSAYSTFAYLPSVASAHFFNVHSAYQFPRLIVYFEISRDLALRRLHQRDGNAASKDLLKDYKTIDHRYRYILSVAEQYGSQTAMLHVDERTTPEQLAQRVENEVISTIA